MLIYTDVKKHNISIDNLGTQTAQSRWSVFADERKVSLLTSHYYTGVRRDNGKRWWRWTTDSAFGFYRHPCGTVIPFHRTRKRNQRGFSNAVPSAPFSYLNPEFSWLRPEVLGSVYREQVANTFDIARLSDLYPIAGMYDIESFVNMPYALRRNMREENFRDFVEASFGKKNMRKDLVKASANVHPEVVQIAREFRGLVPVDWIVNFLRINEDRTLQPMTGRYVNQMRGIMQAVDNRTLRNLLNIPVSPAVQHQISDTFAFLNPHLNNNRQIDYGEIRGAVYRNWHELHDAAFRGRVNNYGKRTPPADVDISLSTTAKKIHDLVTPVGTIKCATNTKDLGEWGSYMGNCISSYVTHAINHYSVLAAVVKDNKIIANIEIKTPKNSKAVVGQILGRFNKNLEKEDVIAIEKALEAQGIVIPVNYWGAPHRVTTIPEDMGWQNLGWITEPEGVAQPF